MPWYGWVAVLIIFILGLAFWVFGGDFGYGLTMTEEELNAVPPEKWQRVMERVNNYGVRCILCFEQLTLAERLTGRAYCADCWLEEPDFAE